MIHESSYWKDDLLKLASTLERRLIQAGWGDKNLFVVEKEIFFGFYSIRKLIESKKLLTASRNAGIDLKSSPAAAIPNLQ